MLLRSLLEALASIPILFAIVDAAPSGNHFSSRQVENCNTPENRACWTSGFDINTDWEQKTPLTGVTRQASK